MKPGDRTAIDKWLDKVLDVVLAKMLERGLTTEEEAKSVGLKFNETLFEEQRMTKPSVGRVVHYQSYGTPGGEFKPLPRAAVITQVNEDGSVGVCAVNPTGLFFHERCPFSEEPEPGHWNWPPRVWPDGGCQYGAPAQRATGGVMATSHAEHQRAYRKRHPERAAASVRAWRERNPEAPRAMKKAWEKRNLEKHRAQRALYKAVRRGTLARPDRCENCGLSCKPHGHHRDYSRRLDVAWLCADCHKAEHTGGEP